MTECFASRRAHSLARNTGCPRWHIRRRHSDPQQRHYVRTPEHLVGTRHGTELTFARQARDRATGLHRYDALGAAIEGLCRQLAAELGPYGVRVACLRSGGSPDTPGVEEVWTRHADNAGVSKEEWWATMAEKTALRRLPMLADVANAAVLLASDHATAITAEITNVTCGELYD